MEELTAREFTRHKIRRRPAMCRSLLAGRPVHTEIEWYRQGPLLGVVIHDEVDDDWAFAALAKPTNEYLAFHLGVYFPSIEAARAALEKALQTPPAEALRTAG